MTEYYMKLLNQRQAHNISTALINKGYRMIRWPSSEVKYLMFSTVAENFAGFAFSMDELKNLGYEEISYIEFMAKFGDLNKVIDDEQDKYHISPESKEIWKRLESEWEKNNPPAEKLETQRLEQEAEEERRRSESLANILRL